MKPLAWLLILVCMITSTGCATAAIALIDLGFKAREANKVESFPPPKGINTSREFSLEKTERGVDDDVKDVIDAIDAIKDH